MVVASARMTDGAAEPMRYLTRQPGPENSPERCASSERASAVPPGGDEVREGGCGSARRKSGNIAPTTEGDRKVNGVACGKKCLSGDGLTLCLNLAHQPEASLMLSLIHI